MGDFQVPSLFHQAHQDALVSPIPEAYRGGGLSLMTLNLMP